MPEETKEKEDHAKQQARAKLDHIVIMVQRLKHQEDCEYDTTDECSLTDKEIIEGLDEWYKEGAVATKEQRDRYHNHDSTIDEINESPLSIQVRSSWHDIADNPKPDEYNILLCTGGPAVRIIGELDDNQMPTSAKIEHQDWFVPWTQYTETTTEEDEALLTYVQQFYFGE